MTRQEILEYNKRCAEFVKEVPNVGLITKYPYTPEKLKFHSDWNWIMEVIEAINKTQNPRQGGDTTHSTLKREVQALLGKAAKEAVVQAINQFLIWYNESRKIS